MCLTKIARGPFPERKEKGNKVAWKIFYKKATQGDRLYTMYQGKEDKHLPQGKWLDEEKWRIIWSENIGGAADSPVYTAGFHMYRLKRNAIQENNLEDNGVVRKVYYRDPVAYGYQHGDEVIVAREIFIPKKGD